MSYTFMYLLTCVHMFHAFPAERNESMAVRSKDHCMHTSLHVEEWDSPAEVSGGENSNT